MVQAFQMSTARIITIMVGLALAAFVWLAPSGYVIEVKSDAMVYKIIENRPLNELPIAFQVHKGETLSLLGCLDHKGNVYLYIQNPDGARGYLWDFDFKLIDSFDFSWDRLMVSMKNRVDSLQCHVMVHEYNRD